MFGCGLGAGSWRRLFGGWPWQALAGGWRLDGGWMAVGWRSSPFGPAQSVHTVGPSSHSRRALKAGVGWLTAGWRWLSAGGRWRLAGCRGRQEEGNSAVALSIKRQKRLPILKTPGHRAQNPRFCARNARKRGFRRAKAHKNLNFVLETPENGDSEAKKSTKTSILCSKRPKMGVSEAKKAQKPRFCAREEGDW